MSITSFFRLLIIALLLSQGGLQAQPLAETYKRQEDLRLSVAKICQSQFKSAQYLPVDGRKEDLRYMISEKGVQGIKADVVPNRSGGSYKCDRGDYELPMLLGRTYSFPYIVIAASRRRFLSSSARVSICHELIASGVLHPSECAKVRKVRFELEPCAVTLAEDSLDRLRAELSGQFSQRITIETSCLVSYTQFDDGLVSKSILAFRRESQSK